VAHKTDKTDGGNVLACESPSWGGCIGSRVAMGNWGQSHPGLEEGGIGKSLSPEVMIPRKTTPTRYEGGLKKKTETGPRREKLTFLSSTR